MSDREVALFLATLPNSSTLPGKTSATLRASPTVGTDVVLVAVIRRIIREPYLLDQRQFPRGGQVDRVSLDPIEGRELAVFKGTYPHDGSLAAFQIPPKAWQSFSFSTLVRIVERSPESPMHRLQTDTATRPIANVNKMRVGEDGRVWSPLDTLAAITTLLPFRLSGEEDGGHYVGRFVHIRDAPVPIRNLPSGRSSYLLSRHSSTRSAFEHIASNAPTCDRRASAVLVSTPEASTVLSKEARADIHRLAIRFISGFLSAAKPYS